MGLLTSKMKKKKKNQKNNSHIMFLLSLVVHSIKLYSILSQMYSVLGNMSNSRDFANDTVFGPVFVLCARLVNHTSAVYVFTKLSVFLLIILHMVGCNFV